MKFSELFGSTLRKAPTNAKTKSYQLLARAGYIRSTKDGDVLTLPLATRALNKLRARIRYETEARGGQEIGAYADITQLAAGDIQSYRQLPKILYAFDEVKQESHPRLGLFGAAHSPSVSFYLLTESQEKQRFLREMLEAVIKDIFDKLDLDANKTDCGGYAFIADNAGVNYIHCPKCGYLDTQEFARRSKNALSVEKARALEKVATPDAHTIESLAEFLNIPKEKTAKAVFMTARIKGKEKLIFAILRGDMNLSETKLLKPLGATSLRPATDDEILAVGAVPGYASPVGISNVIIAVDDLIPDSANLVAGANEEGYHLRNVNYGRDYKAEIITDLVQAGAGDNCPKCNSKLEAVEGVELLSNTPIFIDENATFTDLKGKGQPIWLSSFTLDLGRLLAAVVEKHHDKYGMILPSAIAPYDIHLLHLPSKKIDTQPDADDLYLNLRNTGFTLLYDDRDARAGTKFNDADLIGCPVRITVGERALEENSVEIKLRSAKEKELVEIDDVANYVVEALGG